MYLDEAPSLDFHYIAIWHFYSKISTKNHEKLKIFKNPFKSGKNIPKPARTPSLSKIVPLFVVLEPR